VALFGIITAMVVSGLTSNFDNIVSRYFKSLQGNEHVDALMIGVTVLGDVSTVIIIAILLAIIRRTRKSGIILLITIVIIAILVMYLKPIIARPLPPYGFKPALHLPKGFVIEEDSVAPIAENFSYPSNHIAIVTALAFIVGYGLNRKLKPAGLIIWSIPVLVAISKLYIMQHYPSDLAGGFLLGLIISIIACNLMKLDQPFLISRFKGKEQDTQRTP
jgi:undecaprenyl-diphosphatase